MTTYEKWRSWLLKNIQLQLFLSLISLPFLIAWGLPISIMSPIATILFGPFLTIFLLVSSIIFFLELLTLPNSLPIYILELITQLWLWCLKFGQQSWLIGFTQPSFLYLIAIVIAATAVLHSKKINSLEKRIIYLSALLLIICTGLKYLSHANNTLTTITYNKGSITLINANNTVTLIDPGVIASRPSYESWISFTLVPELIKKTGSLTIDHLIVYKINQRVFEALTFLTTKLTIKNIYIPWWTGKIPLFAWKSYVKLKRSIALSDGKIHSLSQKRSIFKTHNYRLSVEPNSTKLIHYYQATYPKMQIIGSLKEQTIVL